MKRAALTIAIAAAVLAPTASASTSPPPALRDTLRCYRISYHGTRTEPPRTVIVCDSTPGVLGR